jgi:hypothetical protein
MRHSLLLGLVLIATIVLMSPAGAVCVEDQRGNCMGPPAPVDRYAAIAVSASTLKSGISWGWGSANQAIGIALNQCRQQGATDCKQQMWRVNSCLALATSLPETAWATDWGYSVGEARAKAMAGCRSLHGTQCAIQASACTSD